MGRRTRGAAEIAANYVRSPLGTWRITVTSPAGSDTVTATGDLPDVVEETVMPMVQRHTDQIGGAMEQLDRVQRAIGIGQHHTGGHAQHQTAGGTRYGGADRLRKCDLADGPGAHVAPQQP